MDINIVYKVGVVLVLVGLGIYLRKKGRGF
jgi:hypothetical protein